MKTEEELIGVQENEPIIINAPEKEKCSCCGNYCIPYKYVGGYALCKNCCVYKRRLPYERNGNKLQRNQLCPCGSGKKYKKCCIK